MWGTTGGDRDLLLQTVSDGDLCCVIVPNMGKQIVAMQAALEHLAANHPAALWRIDALHVVKSQPKDQKADTSGTARKPSLMRSRRSRAIRNTLTTTLI